MKSPEANGFACDVLAPRLERASAETLTRGQIFD
jgi:hypothetical protein